MEILPHLCQSQHRHAYASCQHVKSYQFTNGETAVDDQLGTEIKDCCDDKFIDDLHRLAGRVAQADDPEARRHIAGKLLFPAALHLWLYSHGFKWLHPSDTLYQECLVLRTSLEFFIEPPTK